MFGAMAMRGLGGLLLLAAALKMYGLAVEPVGGVGVFSEPWLQMLIVEWEIVLGIWLVWATNRWLACIAATATFIAFAGFSFRQAWMGHASCGCLGAIRVNPWLAFGIDVGALSILVIGLHQGFTHRSKPESSIAARPVVFAASCISVLLGLFVGVTTIAWGSPAAGGRTLLRYTLRPILPTVRRG